MMLDKITIAGFKSIKSLTNFDLKPVNILIGANGSGKTNFIDFFRMLRAMLELKTAELKSNPSLGAFIHDKGGMANLLFNGPKTEKISTELLFNNGTNGYRFDINITSSADFLINNEACFYKDARSGQEWWELGGGNTSPKLLSEKHKQSYNTRYDYIYDTISSWQIYHFHDTSRLAGVRMPCNFSDNKSLQFDASNLAAFLYSLKEGYYNAIKIPALNGDSSQDRLLPNQKAKDSYEQIVETVKIIAPYFEDFILYPPIGDTGNSIKLQWKQKGSDIDMQAYHLSDGTLRFICLATALLQPEPPELLLIDEPELGLHPEALSILAELINLSKDRTQFIISTQSPAFADLFSPEEIVAVSRKEGATIFERLVPDTLTNWLKNFSIGQLWQKNVIRGGIVNE